MGWTFPKIARDFGFNISTTKRVWKQYQQEGFCEKKKRTKHHRVTSKDEDVAIARLCEIDPMKTAAAIKKELGLKAAVKTVACRMKEIKGVETLKRPPQIKGNGHKPKRPRPKKPKPQMEQPPQPQPISHREPPCPAYPAPPGLVAVQDMFKEMKDHTASYIANNETYFQREQKQAYYNEPVSIPQFYQQFYNN